jgi:endonuclease VIII
VPEGDTLHRTAAVLGGILVGRTVTTARGRFGGAPLERLAGSDIRSVEARGKHLLIATSNGLTCHTHLGMHGSWHRYRPGERWNRSPGRAVAVIEVDGAVVVCFDAPIVELLDSRAVRLHPVLGRLGPDLLAADADLAEALRRLRAPGRIHLAVGDALLDQGAQSGIGNVYRSEVCFVEGVDPFAPVESLSDETLARLLRAAHRLLAANVGNASRATTPDMLGGPPGTDGRRTRGGNHWVYGRTGRPCRKCGSLIRSRTGGPLARRAYWCPTCQGAASGAATVV